jgi:hypothetical protein
VAAGNGRRNGNGNGDTASHTLRQLREMRAQMFEMRAKMATKDDLSALATKTDLARVEAKLGQRIDVLRRIFKENQRVLTKRVRAVESRVGR